MSLITRSAVLFVTLNLSNDFEQLHEVSTLMSLLRKRRQPFLMHTEELEQEPGVLIHHVHQVHRRLVIYHHSTALFAPIRCIWSGVLMSFAAISYLTWLST